jgi:drug/metabolite transporter (DMT)-like permease
MVFAIVAAIFGGLADIVNKVLLGRLKMPVKDYLPIVFVFLAIVSFCLIPINFHFDREALTAGSLAVLLIMIVAAISWNYLLAKSLQIEPLHEYETIILTVPFVTVALAAVFLPEERQIHTFVAGLIAGLAILFFKFKKHHLHFTKSAPRTALAVVLIAIEVICMRYLLDFYSPALIYFIRVSVIALTYWFIFRPDLGQLRYKPYLIAVILTALFGTGVMVLKYYAFVRIGVVITTIILLLSPLLTYAASYFYLKERRDFRPDLYCALVVIGCIIYAMLS